MKKIFKGIATIDGDDPYCYGVHAMWKDKPINQYTNVIDFLDEQFEKYKDKQLKVTIEIEVIK